MLNFYYKKKTFIYPFLICLFCFGYLLFHLKLSTNLFFSGLKQCNLSYILICICFMCACNILNSIRFKYLLLCENYNLPLRLVDKINIYSLLNGMFFISFVGQSITRSKMLCKYLIPEDTTISITTIEKALTLIALIISGVFLNVFQEKKLISTILINNFFFLNYIICSIWILFGILVLLIKDKILTIYQLKILNKHLIINILVILLLTLASFSCMVGAYLFIGLSIDKNLQIISFISKVPLVMLGASLPISINGWGIRELTATMFFTKTGISYENSIIISILIGIINIISVILSFLYHFYINRTNECRNIQLVGNSIKRHGQHFSKSLLKPTPIARLSLQCCMIFFLVGLFVIFSIKFNNFILNIAPIDFLSIVFCMIYLLQSPIYKNRLFLIFIISSTVMLLSLVVGYINFGSNSWSYVNKFSGWFILWSYVYTGIYLANEEIVAYKNINYSLKLFTVIGLLILSYDLCLYCIELIRAKPLFRELHVNLRGFVCNRNIFSYILCILYASLLVYGNRWFSMVKLNLAFILINTGMFFSSSRTGILSLMLIVCLSIYFRLVSWWKCCRIIFLSLFFILIISNLSRNVHEITSANTNIFIKPLINNYQQPNQSMVQRWRTISEGLQMWKDKPILGHGLGAYIQKEKIINSQPLVIHNTYVWILAEFGIIGFTFYTLGLMMILRKIFMMYKSYTYKSQAIFLLLLMCNFLIFTLAHEMLYQRIHWFLVAYILSGVKLNKSIESQNKILLA